MTDAAMNQVSVAVEDIDGRAQVVLIVKDRDADGVDLPDYDQCPPAGRLARRGCRKNDEVALPATLRRLASKRRLSSVVDSLDGLRPQSGTPDHGVRGCRAAGRGGAARV